LQAEPSQILSCKQEALCGTDCPPLPSA
jgi:hypothetical protein